MKNFLKTIVLNFFCKLPYPLRSKIVFFFVDSLKGKEGLSKTGEFIKFNSLRSLSDDNKYMKLYKDSILKAGDENTDNIYKLLRHLNLYSYIENVLNSGLEGDFAECGCWNGNSLFATKSLLEEYSSKKTIHVFDSFEGGLSEFNKEDFSKDDKISDQKVNEIRTLFSSSYESLIKKTQSMSNVRINKGWIPNVFESEIERKYSFVHIDVDLYQPTLDSHEYFFERLHKGGIIVCDDYGYSQFPGASLAVDKFISSISRDSYSHFFKHSFGTSVIIK